MRAPDESRAIQNTEPRILVPTWRKFNRQIYTSGLYEAQEVLAAVDDVDLLELEAKPKLKIFREVQKRLITRDPTGRVMYWNPGVSRVALQQEYELLVVLCQHYWDLLYLNAVEGWRDRCRKSVCWIDELWAGSVHEFKNWLHALDRFDHVCVGGKKCAEVLSAILGRHCHWVPGGVDALRFSPLPEVERVIDVYGIGRRWEGMHQELLGLAARDNLLYLYDTTADPASNLMTDWRQHRQLYANLAKRSRFFVVAPAKMNSPMDTKGESEIGFRYYEGAAAGAILIGQTPTCQHYADLFGWPEAVIDVNADGRDLVAVIKQLTEDPARCAEISRRNAAEARHRHDWSRRWRDIFAIAGVKPSAKLEAREQRLRATSPVAAAGSTESAS